MHIFIDESGNFTGTQSSPEHSLRECVYNYDGAFYETPRGYKARVRLNKTRVDSVLYELAAMLRNDECFKNAPSGIPPIIGDAANLAQPPARFHPRHGDVLESVWRSNEAAVKLYDALQGLGKDFSQIQRLEREADRIEAERESAA